MRITLPETRYGTWPDLGPVPLLDPFYLTEGETWLRVVGHDSALPHGTKCLYLCRGAGVALVQPEDPIMGPVALWPWQFDELIQEGTEAEFDDWQQGYDCGRWESLNERRIATGAKGRTPTYFGMGVSDGYRDALAGITRGFHLTGAFNARWRKNLLLNLMEAIRGRANMDS